MPIRTPTKTGADPTLLDDPFVLSRETHLATQLPDGPLRLLVIVDTEETFDWDAPFDSDATDTSAMSEVGRGQDVCEAAGVAPTYVVGYPVASDAKAMDSLSGFSKNGKATIGGHLHTWVCPPFEEEVNNANSYQGNLPHELEKRKLESLCERIAQSSGVRPRVHRAGRYGFGWRTAEIIKELGFLVDMSPTPGFDMTRDGGPNHESVPNAPQWLDAQRELLCIAGTGGFVGKMRNFGPLLSRLSESPMGLKLHAGSIFSRLDFYERIRLSPEGFSLDEMKRLTHSLIDQGEKVLTLSFHSPSLKVGGTPYVRNKQDLKAFLQTLEDYFSYFLNEIGGRPATPLGLRDELVFAEEKQSR